MSDLKADYANLGTKAQDDGEALPAYSVTSGESSTGARSAPSTTSEPYQTNQVEGAALPTIDSPFNFPSEAPPPFESLPHGTFQQPIAIPQVMPTPESPFLPAWAPTLLAYGITPPTWRAFITTMSGFLSASVSERAVAHAGDMGKQFAETPKNFGKNTMDHAKDVGKSIVDRARRGNIIGAAAGVIGGAIALPIGTAFRAVGAVFSLPGSVVAAVTKKPRTPRERASAYALTADKQWLAQRGLRAVVMNSNELSEVLQIPVFPFLDLAKKGSDASARGQMHALTQKVDVLEIEGNPDLQLAEATLWLVILPEHSIRG